MVSHTRYPTPIRRRPPSGWTPSTPSSRPAADQRARFLLMKLLERARASQVGFPATVSSPYINSIPPDEEPWFPGDEYLERRIRAYIRWNAAVMVTRANMRDAGIGGHLSTYASSASLYEVGFNHFFRGKDNGTAGDQVYLPGPCLAGHLRPRLRRGSAGGRAARQLPFRGRRQRVVQLPPPPPHAGDGGSSRPSRWASAR